MDSIVPNGSEKQGNAAKEWIRGWILFAKVGTPLTRRGRSLRQAVRAPMSEFVQVDRPGGDA